MRPARYAAYRNCAMLGKANMNTLAIAQYAGATNVLHEYATHDASVVIVERVSDGLRIVLASLIFSSQILPTTAPIFAVSLTLLSSFHRNSTFLHLATQLLCVALLLLSTPPFSTYLSIIRFIYCNNSPKPTSSCTMCPNTLIYV